MLPLVNHGEYADGTDRQTDRRTDGRQTVTLRFPIDAASITTCNKLITVNTASGVTKGEQRGS